MLDRAIRYPLEDAPEPGQAVEVAAGILWMRLPLPMALNHVNVYALDDGDGWTLIDTGLDTRRIRAIWDDLLTGPLAGKPVTRVLVTHHHPDHIGLAGWFQREHGANLLTTRTAWLFARMLLLDVQDTVHPKTEAFWRGAGMDADILEARLAERPFNFSDALSPLPLGFTRIAEGDRLHAGGRDWIVRCGGGHAPEHATLWSTDGEVVLGGDQLLPSISPNIGVYATEPEADPLKDWLDSCARFTQIATPEALVLPGHKLPYTGLPSRLDQLQTHHDVALNSLKAFLAEPRTAVDCFPTLYKRSINGGEYTLALGEAMAHCLYLWHRGDAVRSRRADGAWLWHVKGKRHDG